MIRFVTFDRNWIAASNKYQIVEYNDRMYGRLLSISRSGCGLGYVGTANELGIEKGYYEGVAHSGNTFFTEQETLCRLNLAMFYITNEFLEG